MLISLVVAMSRQGVIGKNGQLPWTLPRDLKRFREVTWGKPIVMGRKTHESIGRPLPGRTNLILTHQADFRAEGCRIVHSPSEAVNTATAIGATELMVIGGRQVYEAFLPGCRTIHLTLVEGTFDGDTFFPVDLLASPDWEVAHEENWPAYARNPFDATYRILHRHVHTAT
jgi:dihydrofolate reductase